MADDVYNSGMTNDQLATWIRVLAYLNTRAQRAGRTGEAACRAVVPIAAVLQMTGRLRRDVALTLLRSLADFVDMTVVHRGDVIELAVPKFAEFQENTTRRKSKLDPQAARPVTDTDTDTVTVDTRTLAADAAGRESGDDRSTGNGKAKPPRSVKPAKPESVELAQRFASLIAGNVAFARPPRPAAIDTLHPWALDVDKLIRLDAVEADSVEAVMRWVVTDEFWRGNILSPSKLRAQMPKLHAAMRRENPTPPTQPTFTSKHA